MQNLFQTVFFLLALFIIFYSYLGYGLLLYIILRLRKGHKKIAEVHEPDVTLIVAAYNEQDFIQTKIDNSLSLKYPKGKLQFIFITDGSTDDTPNIVKKTSAIRLMHQSARKGKTAALNRAMKTVTTPIVIFTDANTLLNENAIKEITKHYYDPKVGGVAGEKKVISNKNANAEAGEGIYWKYESFLKKQDSDFYTVVGAAGELFSIRTELYEELEENVLLDDFIISLRVCSKGFRVAYEPNAYAIESPSESMKEEQKRKIRISAGSIQAMIMLKSLLNPFKNPKLFFQYVSHRVLRWTLCPLLLPVIFFFNIWLCIYSGGVLFYLFLITQIIFYLLAAIGWVLANRNVKSRLLYIPYYFVFMNASVYLGFIRYMKKNQSVLWEKAARKKPE
jgi:biofilm PGA synthesis N-glycosyltransferase PgaC